MIGKILGIVGGLAGVVSLLLPWAKLVFIKFGEESIKQIGGLQTTQGILVAVLAGLGTIVLFLRPKLASVFGALTFGAGTWFYLTDLVGTPKKPAFGLWVALLGGLLLILAGFMNVTGAKHQSGSSD